MLNQVSTIPTPILNGFTFDIVKFTIANVAEAKSAKQLTELAGSTEWIIKEVMFYNWDTNIADGYAHLNSTDTDTTNANRFGETYLNVFSAIIIDDDMNGKKAASLTAKPYIHISGGTGATARTVYGVVKYYYK